MWGLQAARATGSAHDALRKTGSRFSSSTRFCMGNHAGPAVLATHNNLEAAGSSSSSSSGQSSREVGLRSSLPGDSAHQQACPAPAGPGPAVVEDWQGLEGETTRTMACKDAFHDTFAYPTNGMVAAARLNAALPLYAVGRKCAAPYRVTNLRQSRRLLQTDGRVRVRVPAAGSKAGGAGERQAGSLSVKREDAAAVSWVEQPLLETAGYLSVYKELSKIKLSGLVVLTTMVGYAMAPGAFSGTELFLTTLGTSFCVASANTLNQWIEVPYDSQMKRTKNRPVVRGAISPLHALAVGVGFGLAGAGVLCTTVNHATAFMGTGNTILYAGVYTYMKRTSIYNTWVGSVVGAVPPLIGWVAATGGIDTGGMVLAAALYAWQFPHFNALSWNLRGDYSRAGYRMMSVTDPKLCRQVALRYSAAMIPISLMASYCGMCDWWLALDSTVINGFLTYRAWQFYKDANDQTARKLFMASIWHLPAFKFSRGLGL
eukprot:gene10211-9704_t